MNYEEAMAYLCKPRHYSGKLGLNRIKKLMEAMGNPHKGLNYVHIAGTNGKGSTASMIAGILAEAGYKTGVYTSPHIHRYNERIQCNGREISKGDMIEMISLIKERIEQEPCFQQDPLTEFEMITAMAFQYFLQQQCDIVILEAGLGGRLDATNIIENPELAVVTTISYDHQDVLGNSLEEIAFEKAGIVKEQSDVLLYPQEQKVQSVFDVVCKEKKARLHEVDFTELTTRAFDGTKQVFDFGNYKGLELPLLGAHQVRNAAMAIEAIELLKGKGYPVSDQALTSGLKKAEWPGRFEVVHQAPVVVIDAAHNMEGVKILSHNLQEYFPNKKITFLWGVLADKEYMEMTELLLPFAYRFVTVTPDSTRALRAEALAMFLRTRFHNVTIGGEIRDAIEFCVHTALPDEVICVFGSFYYIGTAREYFGYH